MADVEIQLLEQEKLIEQLKSMIRERDESFQQKEKELQDVNAKLSKLKLQAKAKVAKEAKEAKEGKGGKSGSTKKDTKDSLEEKEKGTAETEHDGTSRAKSLLLRKKLEDKDRVIREKDEEIQAKEQRVLAKEKIIAEREEIIESLTTQLQEKTNLMEEYQTSMDPSGNISETEERLNQMYAQIVYKDKNLLDLNNKMLEQERKMIDIQELVGEKNEVIRGRDKVIELLQSTIKEKDQNVHDQALLISRLTTKVEASDEIMGQLLEQVQKAEHNLKQERERFDLRLTESQKYFEETLKEQEEGVAKLQKAFQDKEAELLVSENDLRELLRRHEEDIQNIMSKGEVNIHDQVVQMLEQKLKDTNEVLEGKIKVIEVLQKESSQKDKEINESREVQKSLKDKLQVMSEQVMLFQANIADMESQWQEERRKHETKLNDLVEKHETELTEKDLKIQTLESSVSQLEAAYTQSSVQYNVLQDRYHSLLKPGGAVSVLKEQTADKTPVSVSMKEHESEEMECLKQKLDSLTLILKDKEQELTEMKEKIEEKEAELEKLKQSSEIEGTESKDLVEEISVLKNLLAELEEEKGSLQLKLVDFDEAKVLQGELQSKLADLKQQVEKVELEKAAADQSLILSCEERDELQKVVDDLQSDLDSTREILQQVQSELKSEKDLIGQLQGEKVSLEVRAAEAEEQREVVEREKADLQSLLESLRNKIESDMQQPLLDIERERDELKQKVSSLEEEAANQTHISKEIKEELNATAVQLRDKEAELSSLQAELASVKDQLDTHMQQIKELSVLKEDHLAQITGLQQELRTVKEDNMKTEERLQQSSEEYQSLIEQEQEKLKQTQSTYEETYKLLESAQTDHKEAKAVIEKQNTELSEKTAQLCMFKDSYFELKDKYENCQLCVQQQKEETDDLLSVFDISDLNLKGAKDLIISLQNELVTNKQELFDSHAKQTRLKQDLVQLETEHTEKMQIIHSQTGEEAEKWKESVAELNELITKKDECTEKLSLELEEVKRKLEESVLEVNQHKRQIDILKESQFSRGDEFQSRIQSLILQISDMEKLLSEKNNIIQEHCKKFETLNCELERITVESSSCKNEISHLKSNCDQKDKIVADLSYSYSQLEENMKELQSQCHNLQSENNDKDNKIQELTHTFSLSESSFREEQRKNSDLNCQVNIIESENFKLKEGITERDSAISKLLNRLNEDSQSRLLEEKQISYLKTSNEETIQCLKSLECEAENVKSELETTQMELNKIKNLCSEKDTAVKELNETVETITKENQELRSSSSETSASLISTQASLEEIAEKLKTSEAMLTTVQAENENLQKQVSGMQLECNLKHEQLCSLQASLSQVQTENESLLFNLHNVEKVALDCSSDVVSLLKHVCCMNSEVKEKFSYVLSQHDKLSQDNSLASSSILEKDTVCDDVNIASSSHQFGTEHETLALRNYLLCMKDNLYKVKTEIHMLNLNSIKVLDSMSDIGNNAKDIDTVLASLQSENSDLRANVQTFQIKLNEKLSEIEILKSSQSDLKDTVTKLQERIKEIQTEEALHKLEYETKINKLKEQVYMVTKNKDSFEETNQSLLAAKQDFDTENSDVLIENQLLKCQICDLNDNLKIIEEKCFSLEGELQLVKQNWTELQTTLIALENSYEIVLKEKQTLQKKFDFTKEKVDILHEDRDKYKYEVQKLTEELKKLADFKISSDCMNEVNTGVCEAKEHSTNSSMPLKSESEAIQKGDIDVKIKIESLELEILEQTNAYKDLQAQNEQLQTDLNSLNEKLKFTIDESKELQMLSLMFVLEKESIDEEVKTMVENTSHQNLLLKLEKVVTERQAIKKELLLDNVALKSNIGTLEHKLSDASAAKLLREKELAQIESELHKLHDKVACQECDLDDLSMKLSVLEKELDNANCMHDSSKAVLNNSKLHSHYDKQHIVELEGAISHLKEENRTLKNNNQALCHEKDELLIEIDELQKRNKIIEKSLDNVQETLICSESSNEAKVQELSEMQSKFQEIEHTLARKQGELVGLQKQCNEVSEKLRYVSEQNELISWEVLDLNTHIFSLEAVLKKTSITYKLSTEESKSKIRELTNKENVIHNLQSQLEIYEDKIEEMKDAMTILKSDIQQKNVVFSKLSEVLQCHGVDDERFITNVSLLVYQKAETQAKVVELERKGNEAQIENKKLRDCMNELEAVNEKLRSELGDLRTQLRVMEDTKQKIIEEADDLTGVVAEYKNRLLTAENVISERESSISSLSSDIYDLKSKKDCLEKESYELEEQTKHMIDSLSKNKVALSKIKDELQNKEIVCQDLSSKLRTVTQNLISKENTCKELEKVSHSLIEEVLKLSSLLDNSDELDNMKEPLPEPSFQETVGNTESPEQLCETVNRQTQSLKQLQHKCLDLQESKKNIEQKHQHLLSELSKIRDQSLQLHMQIGDLSRETDGSCSSPSSPFEHLDPSAYSLENNDHCWLTELSRELDSLQSSLQSLKVSFLTKEDNIKKMHEQMKESGVELEEARDKIVKCQQLLNEKETEISNLANNVQELQTNLEKIKEERDLKIELLSDNVTELVAKLDECTHQKDDLESELNDAISNLDNTEAARFDLENKLKSSEICLEEKSAALEVLQDQFSGLGDENSKLVKSVHECERIILSKDGQIEELALEKQNLLLDRTKLERTKEDLSTTAQDLREKLAVNESELVSIKNELMLTEKEMIKLQEELKNSSSKVSDLTSEISYLESSVEDYKEEILALESNISDLKENLCHMKAMNKDLYSELNNKDTQFHILADDHETVLNNLRSENAACAKLCFDNTLLRKNIERFEERVDEASMKENELKMFVDTYSIQIEELNNSNLKMSESLCLGNLEADRLNSSLKNEQEAHLETKMAMEKLIEDHKQKNNGYEMQMNILQNSVISIQLKVSSLESECKELKFTGGKLKEMKNHLMIENKALSSQNEKLEKQLLEQFQWVSEFKREAERKERRVEKHENLEGKASQLEILVQELKEDQRMKSELIESLKKEILLLQKQLQEAEIKSLALVVSLETEKDSLMAQLEDMKSHTCSENVILQNSIKSIKDVVANEERTANLVETNSNSLLMTKPLENEVQTSKVQLKEDQVEIQKCQSKISLLEAENESLSLSVSDLTSKNCDLIAEIENLQLITNEWEDKLEILEQDHKKSLSDLSSSVTEVERLSCQVKESDLRNRELFQTSVELSQKIEDRDIELEKIVQCLNIANTNLDECQRKIDKKDGEIHILENSISNLREEYLSDKSVLSRLMIDMKGANHKFSVLIDTIIEKDAAMSEFESNLCRAHERLKESDSKIVQLTEENRNQIRMKESEIADISTARGIVEKSLNEKASELKIISSEIVNMQEVLKTTDEKLCLCVKEKTVLSDELILANAEIKTLSEQVEFVKSTNSELENIISEKNSECLNFTSSLQQGNTQIEYLLQSSKCMTDTLERKESETVSLKEDIESMAENMSKYETLIMEKNTQICALVEELENNKTRLWAEMSGNAKLTLQKQNLSKMLLAAQTEVSDLYTMKEKDDKHYRKSLWDIEEKNKSFIASLEQSKEVLSENQDKISLILFEKSALVTKLKHDTEIGFKDIRERYRICREDLLNFKQDIITNTESLACQMLYAVSEFIDSHKYNICSLQAMIGDQSEALKENKTTIIGLEKERDEILEQLNVRKANYDSLITKYKSLEEEKQRLMSDCSNCGVELTNIKEALKHKTELIETLEKTVQDTKCQLDEILADKNSFQNKNSILENDNSFLSEEVRRLNSFAGEYSSMEESYKGTIANLTLQYELISAELETEREKVLNLNALKKCFEKEDRVETSKQGSDRAVNATTELDKIESVQNTNFIQNKLSSIDVVHEVETNKEEELNDVIKMQNQQICLLEREITNLKEAQISQIEWDDYDLRDICNKLEKEKQDLSAEIANQEKQIKKKDSQIKTLYRQLESLHEEQLQEGSKHANTNMQEPDFEPSNQLETEKNTTSEIHEPCITPSYGTDLQSVTSAGEMPGYSDTVSSDLGERLRKVTLERDKFKSDNKKLLKVGKGKDAKLDIMNKNFEKLRHERDSLLAERDSLENDLQDLRTSNFDSSYDKEVINSLMMRCKELEAVCAEKQLECSKVNQDINVTDRGDQAQLHIAVAGDIPQSNIFLEKSILSPANTLEQEQNMSGLSTADKSASQLKTDILKLQKVNKGKEAKVRKLEEKLLLQENEIRIHKEILSQKESDLSGLMEERIVFEKTRDEKIILDFELQCAKEELAKYRQIENTEYAEDKTKKDLPPAENEDDKDVFDISEFSPDIIRARIVTVLQENKKLKQENGKLQKLSKGKEAKVKKVEDLISQQQKLISDRETDILILKESVKDLTEKVTSLTEDENDLRYRLENAILDRDEWYDHCQDLEDQLDAAHESIDIKNEELLRLDETAMADRETIDSLLDEKESLEQEVLTLQNELDSSKNAIDKKDEQIINFETQLKSLAEEKEKLSAEIRKLHMVKKGKDAKAKKLEESVLVQENAMEAKEEVIEKLENRLQETEIQTQALENEVIELKSEMQAQEKNKEVLQSKERELKSTLEELKCNLTIQSQQMKDLQDNNSAQAVTFQSQMSKMAADIHLSIARENELKEKIHNESRHRNELVKKIEESEQEIQQMKSLLIMKDEYISDIENQQMEVNSALHEKELLLLSTQETVNKLSSQIDDKDKEIMLLNNKITDNEQHLETLGNAADQQNVASYTLQEQLKNLSFAHVELKDILQKKEEELVSVSEKCEALKKQFESNMLLIQVKDDEINSARKKYLTLDEAAVIKQSLIEEKEKQLSTMSEELLKLKKIFEEKVTMIDNYERDIQDLTVEKVSLLQKSEMDSKELAATKEQILAEKLAVEQNLSWYIQYYETSNASMIALQEEQNNNAIQLKDMTARLAEQSECLEVTEESKLKAIQEKAQLQDEMQSQLNQALEKIALYDSDLKEKNRIEVSLRNELENLRCQHQKLEDETCQELSEKSRIISKLKSDLQESLNTKIKMNEEMNLQNMDISAVKEAVPADASNLIDESSLNNQETLPANKDNSNSISCQTEVQKLKKLCKAKDTKIKKLEDNLKHLSVANSDRASSVIHDYEHTDTDALKAHLKQIECLLTETQQEKEKLQIDANTFSQQSLSRQREIERLIGAQQEAAVLENSLQNQITHLQNLSDTLGKDLEKSRIVCDAVESDLLKVQAEYDDFKHHCQLNTDELKSELSNAYSQIANLNQLNEDLGFKLESVSSEKEEYISVIDLKDNELKNLKDILRVKMTEIQDLENKMKLVENSGTSLQSEKEAFETLLKSEREEIQSLYEQMNELVSEKLDLETIVQGKEQDLKAAKEALQALACDREKLETVLSEKEEFQLELETLSRDLSTLRERLGQRDSEKEVLLYNLQQKENDIVSIQEQLQVSVAEKEKLTVKLNSLNDDLISSDEKVEVLSKELETKKEAASKLKDMCFEKDHLMLSLKETISTVSDEIKSLKHQKEQVYEELIFYKEKYHQESNKNHSIEAKLGNLSDKCNQLEINVTEKDNTLISKAEEIGLLHRRITSLEELLNRCQQYASHQPQQIVEENVIKLQTAYVQGVESSIAKEHQYAVVPDISSIESQVMRTEDPMQLMGMQTAEEPRQTDQVQTQELKAAEQGLNKEVGELRNKLSQKDEEIERLNAMIGLKTDSYNTLDRKLHEKDEKIAFLLENMQEMEERLSQLSNSEETDVSQSEMHKKEEEIQHLTQLVEEKEFKFTKALATAKKLKQQLNQVSAALEQEKVEKQSLEQQLKHAQEEFAVVQQELKVLTEVKGGQQIQIAEEASLHKKAELQLAELQSQLTTYVEFCQQLQGQVHSLTEQVHSSEAQLKHVEDQKQYLLGEKQAIEQILTEKEEYLKEDRTEIEDLKLSLKKQQTMLAEKEKMNALIQQELDAAVKSQIDEAKNQEEILQMQEEVKHFQKKASELETKVEELEDLVTSKDSTIKEKQGTIDELEQQCCGYQSTVQLLQSEMKATVEQINTLTHNIEEEKAERNYSQSECDGFKLRIEELESQLKIQMEKYADTDKYFEEYEVRVNQFSDENAALQMQLSQKDSDFRNSLENKDSQIELLSNEITSKVSKLQELETVICQFNIDKEEWNHKIILINKTLEENEERVRSYCSLLDEKDQSMQLLTDSNDRLKEQVNNVETNNASLKDSLKILQADVEILQEDQSKLTVLQNKIVELESVIARMIEEKDTLTKEKEGLLQKHKSTETQLAVRDEEFEKVRVENEEFRTVSEKLENELVNTKQKMNILQQDEEEKCSKIQTLCGEIDVLKLQLADFESWKQEVQLRATTAEAEMDSKVYTLTLEVSAAKENIEKHLQIEHELNQQIELTKEQMHCLAEEKTKLIEDLNYSLMEVESLNAKVETGKQEKDCLLKDLEEKISNERLFNDRLADLTGKVIEINERNAELSALIDKKTAENTELMNELDNLKIIISETEDSLKKLYSEHGLQKTEYENLMIEFENLKGSLDSSLEANQVLQEELQVLKSAQVTETVERPSELIVEHIPIEQTQLLEQSENEQILEEFQADTTQPLTATLTVEGANSEKLKQELEELKQSFLDLSEEYKDTTNKLITSEAKSDKMLKKLRTFKEKNDSLQMEISTLNEQISSANSVISINKKQMDDLHNQIGVWQERHMNEEGQHHRSKVENKALKSELNERDNQIQELKLQVSAQLDEKKQIELSLNNEKYDMEKQLQMLKSQDEEISKQNKDIQEEVERLRKSLSQIEKSRQEYHLKCDDLQMSVSTLESQISVNCKEISDLKEENKLLTEKYSSSSILQDDLMQKKEAAQRQAADMKEQYQMLEQDNKNFQDLIEKTSSTNNDLKNENIQQKMVIEKLQDDIKGIEDNKQSMKKLEMAFKELESEKFNLEEEMEDLRKDVLSLKKQNKTVEDEAIALKHEVLSLRSENQSCTKTINGLNWKIDELKASEIEFENLQKSSDQLTKVIKDLENENEKLRNELSELDSRNKELQDTWSSVTEKESGILQELETSKESLQELKSIKTELSKFKLECETLKSEKVSLLAAVENEKAASNSVKKQLDKVNKKLQAFDMLKDEYEFINNEYNKLLNDNSELSKQIEELHSRLKEITTGKENTDMNQIQKEHFDRERSNLLKRVEHLESQCQELRSKNSELTENEAKLLHDFQEIEFERDRLIAREETSIHRTEDKLGRFQGDYDRLQQQFTTVMQQKNKIQMDLNLAQRGLNQRETRCQQLALQVSQLAEDRSYLNVQMAALSKALREKEQEASVVAQQYRTLYQAYVTLKATIVELERQTVTDMMYGTSTTTPNTSTPAVSTPTTSRGHSPAIGAARRLDSTDSVPRHLSNHDLEKVLKLTQQEQMLHEQDMSAYRLGLEDKEEEPGRVKVRPVLTRRGRGYLDRLQRLMSLQRSVPPVTAPE